MAEKPTILELRRQNEKLMQTISQLCTQSRDDAHNDQDWANHTATPPRNNHENSLSKNSQTLTLPKLATPEHLLVTPQLDPRTPQHMMMNSSGIPLLLESWKFH
ncbi:hypothetical protein VNO78_07799 [Psophocarpus tetragonolobus]|uniref:Uncharacterized protein n=1 Tax=Psophocarpus tetragonolobus TaxID=3891 RepID=A0AAN9XSR6_PSOTE